MTTVPDPVAAATFGARYVFATLDQTELSMVTRMDWTFAPTLSLQLYLQPLISAGDFTESEGVRRAAHLRLRRLWPGQRGRHSLPGRARRSTRATAGRRSRCRTRTSPSGRCAQTRSCAGNGGAGSTLFLVWQQNRDNDEALGDVRLGRDLDAVFSGGESRNVLAVKASYWLSW